MANSTCFYFYLFYFYRVHKVNVFIVFYFILLYYYYLITIALDGWAGIRWPTKCTIYFIYLFTNKQTEVLLKWDQSSIKGGCILQCFHCDFKTQRRMQNRRCVMIWNMLLWKICLLKVNGLGLFFFFFFLSNVN